MGGGERDARDARAAARPRSAARTDAFAARSIALATDVFRVNRCGA
jgi:hypothetical protein